MSPLEQDRQTNRVAWCVLIALGVTAWIAHQPPAAAPEPERLKPSVTVRLAPPASTNTDLGDLETPGAFAAKHSAKEAGNP